jgi:hypothetical protein
VILLGISFYLVGKYRKRGVIPEPDAFQGGRALRDLGKFPKIKERIAEYEAKNNRARHNVTVWTNLSQKCLGIHAPSFSNFFSSERPLRESSRTLDCSMMAIAL